MKKIITLAIVFVLMVAGYWRWSGKLPWEINQATLKVYGSFPMGRNAGKSSSQAVTLKFEEVRNRAGKYRIEFVSMDDSGEGGAWDGEKEKNNASRAADDPDAVAYIGPQNSGAAKIAMPIINQAGMTQISMANTWPGLTKTGFGVGEPGVYYPTGKRHYFRVVTTDDLQGPAAALWADDMELTSAYILHDGEVYGKGVAQLFEQKYRELGRRVVGNQQVDKKATSFKELTKKMAGLKPKMIYFGGTLANGIVPITKELRELGYTGAIMGPDGILDNSFVERVGGKYAEGVYATSVGIPVVAVESPEAREFLKKYKARYGEEPEIFGALAYDSAGIVLRAIAQSDGSRADVLRKMSEGGGYTGMYGELKFDENGDVLNRIVSGNVVKEGKFAFIKKLKTP